MTDAPDAELLERFARDHSETAFAVLVERHLGLVHSVALRHTANPQHAQDITQAVFIILARKAAALNRKTVLPGWLYHTARLTAANFQRAENRRIRREQEAYMQSTLNEAETANAWTQMSPLVDEAMSHLRAGDRDALVLRYFQNKSLPEVGAAMGLAERAAQKRVARAIEKLRKFFAKRGVELSSASLTGAVSVNSIQAAPATLIKTTTAVALAKGAAASTSTLTIVKGALKIMAWTKTKTVITASIVALFAATTTTITVVEIHKHQVPKGPLSPSTVTGTAPDPSWTNSPLFMAIYNGDDAKADKLVDTHPELISQANGDAGATPLHIAACYGRSAFLSDLLMRGADINARTVHGHTALYDAIDRSHTTCATILLDHNADTTIKDDTGRTVYQLAIAGRHVTGLQTLQKYGVTK